MTDTKMTSVPEILCALNMVKSLATAMLKNTSFCQSLNTKRKAQREYGQNDDVEEEIENPALSMLIDRVTYLMEHFDYQNPEMIEEVKGLLSSSLAEIKIRVEQESPEKVNHPLANRGWSIAKKRFEEVGQRINLGNIQKPVEPSPSVFMGFPSAIFDGQ